MPKHRVHIFVELTDDEMQRLRAKVWRDPVYTSVKQIVQHRAAKWWDRFGRKVTTDA